MRWQYSALFILFMSAILFKKNLSGYDRKDKEMRSMRRINNV